MGRPLELGAIEQQLRAGDRGMVGVTLEGEPGIGKTRLLLGIEEMARDQGYCSIAVTADEEIRGPFLLARSIFASPAARTLASGTPAEEPMERVIDALSGGARDVEALSPERRVMRVFDLAAMALGHLAAANPLAILIDDFQWADEDSIRLLRYAIRVDAASRIFFAFGVRRDEVAFVNEAVTLLADLERMGLLRRLRLARFSQAESTEFLQQTLGGRVALGTAATMHAQAEGVPFLLGEQIRAYRDAALIQQIDGVWTLARNAERLVPSAVRTLIQRRAARLADKTKGLLAEAAVLGRSFSVRDLLEVEKELSESPVQVADLAEALEPAVAAGLLARLPEDSPAEYSFTHGQIREYALALVPLARKRSVHAAIVRMLTVGQEPSDESLPVLAQHALAAGEPDLAVRFAIRGARAALRANAPEETLRLVDIAHSVASTPGDRVALLRLRDDALHALRRPGQRLEGLAELAALAEALRDSNLELDVLLRRAAALRLSQEHDRAADMARRVRELATAREDPRNELAACMELGQDLLRSDLGEGYAQTYLDSDIDGAAEAFGRAAELARGLGDQSSLAASIRELGIIKVSRLRAWFVETFKAGEHIPILSRVAAGERLDEIMPSLPVASIASEAASYFSEALEIYEGLGDRQGTMATIIAMAFMTWGPEIHLGGSAKRIEEIRRLSTQLKSLTNESERAIADAQMLFGAHVYSRSKVFPDAAITKGQEAYRAARGLGDHLLEFAAAGGVAMAYAGIGAIDEAEEWLGKAAAAASVEPTPYRARELTTWRGLVRSAVGDAEGMRENLQKAVQLAMDQGRAAARCEALAMLAREAARLGAERTDKELLSLAEQTAEETRRLAPLLAGQHPWVAQADAALARVARARGDDEKALLYGRAALAYLQRAEREDMLLEIVLPAADAVIAAGSEEEVAAIRGQLRLMLALLTPRFADEDVRARWFTGPLGRELRRLAAIETLPEAPGQVWSSPFNLAVSDAKLLRLLSEGRTNREIAEQLAVSTEEISHQLAALFAKIGATSRADATSTALMGRLI